MASSRATAAFSGWPRQRAIRPWVSSSTMGMTSLPVTATPIWRQWFSMMGSSSSTTRTLSTWAANWRIFSTGMGQDRPSFSTQAFSPKISRTYW